MEEGNRPVSRARTFSSVSSQEDAAAKKFRRKEKRRIKEIGKKHPEYELTAAMMLGIRTTVGNAESKAPRPLRPEDMYVSTKLRFPSAGSMLTPAHSMRDFKFKDYAPEVFRHIRERFGINPADYLLTVCGSFRYLEFISNSKSGQFFFYTHDRKFMIKTISQGEARFLRQILPAYYDHVMNNPSTLLAGFYGLHRVKPHKRKTFYFLVMASVFYTSRFIHSTFDLKGSLQGREVSLEERLSGNCVYKDKDFLKMKVKIKVGPARAYLLKKQLRSDVEFMRSLNIMDYSLLLGIHYKDRAQPSDYYTVRRHSMHSQPNTGAGTGMSARHATLTTSRDPSTARRFSLPHTMLSLDSHPRSQSASVSPRDEQQIPGASGLHGGTGGSDEDDLLVLPRSRNNSQPLSYPSGDLESGVPAAVAFETRQADYGLPKRYNRRARPTDDSFVGRFLDAVEPRDESQGSRSRASTLTGPPKLRPSPPREGAPQFALSGIGLESKKGEGAALSSIELSSLSAVPRAVPADSDSDMSESMGREQSISYPSELFEDHEKASQPNQPESRPPTFLVPVQSIFCADDGGCPGQLPDGRSSNEVYYFGVIDILTEFNAKKKLESTWKSIRYDKKSISAVNPKAYGERFIRFLEQVIQ